MGGIRSGAAGRWADLRGGFWFTATLVALCGPALMAALVTVDTLSGEAGVFPLLFISPSSAQTILGAIAGSLVTVAALTSSLTIVTLQLLSTQFTPRALRGFLRGHLSQIVVGALVGIFIYCVLVAVAVRDPGTYNRPFVPSLSVVVSIVLAVGGLVLLVVFVHHLAETIQVSHLTATIAAQSRRELATAPEEAASPTEPGAGRGPFTVHAARPGYVRGSDVRRIAAVTPRPDDTVRLLVRVGEFVTTGAPLAELYTAVEPTAGDIARLGGAVQIREERDVEVTRSSAFASSPTSRCAPSRPVSTTPAPRSPASATSRTSC